MRIVGKYIVTEIIHSFSLALIIVTFTMLSGNILELTSFVMVKGIGVWDIIKLFFLVMPFFVTTAIPIALFFSVIVTFGKLSVNNEILALKAAGIGIMPMIRPVLAVCAVIYIITNLLMIYVLPWTNHASRETLLKIARKGIIAIQREKTFSRLSDDILIYVNTNSPSDQNMKGIFIYNTIDKDLPYVITAKEGTVFVREDDGRPVFNLKNGTVQYKDERDMQLDFIHFLYYDFVAAALPESSVSGFGLVKKEYYLDELLEKIRELSHSRRDQLEYLYILHRKFSLPVGCIFMGIIGMFVGLRTKASRSFAGVVWGTLFIMLYYLLMLSGERLIRREMVGPLLGAWLPNIVFMAIVPIAGRLNTRL
ncbi:MAG: YjgP/YjgQ family permease [Desulfobacterales bacterium]|nr:YjgP/YjgQ family permease [Desulfobacterales bacterium]